jgi:hypothetical protein
VTRQPLVSEDDRDPVAEAVRDRLDPRAGGERLLPLVAGCVDRQPDDEHRHAMAVDEQGEGRDIGIDASPAREGGQRTRADIRGVGERDADPPLSEVDAEQRRHGFIAAARTSTRASSVGIEPTQSGQTDSSVRP